MLFAAPRKGGLLEKAAGLAENLVLAACVTDLHNAGVPQGRSFILIYSATGACNLGHGCPKLEGNKGGLNSRSVFPLLLFSCSCVQFPLGKNKSEVPRPFTWQVWAMKASR